MVDEILRALLWRSRLAVRAGGMRAFAGDGYVDPSYRPPAVPFVSVVGPLSFAVEPERENGKPGEGLIAIPGHLIGAVRAPGGAVPASGGLRLRFDRRARVDLALAGLPTTPWSDPATGPAVATAIADAIAAAVLAGQVFGDDGLPLADPAVDAALAQVSVRWSQDTRQFAISSAPSADPISHPSSVESLSIGLDLGPLLGLTVPAVRRDGKLQLHKLPAPRAVTVEVRLDLWTANQADMAAMFEAMAATIPTRGGVALRPSLLAADPAQAANTLTLLDTGEPTTLESLVHLEGGDGLVDRARAAQFVATAPAALTAGRFHLEGTGTIGAIVYRPPLVPNPLYQLDPAPLGFAVALGLQVGAGAADGDSYPLLRITRGAGPTEVCSLALAIEQHTVGAITALYGVVIARATLTGASGDAVAETRWRLPLTALEAAATLHARVDAVTGAISLWHAGVAQLTSDVFATPVQTFVPGRPTMGIDLTVTLGSPASALPTAVEVSHLHVSREPIGPLDPKLRSSLTRAAQLRPGDQVTLATTSDGWRTSDAKHVALVSAVTGTTVTITKPLPAGFARGTTLVFQEQCFFFQTGVKRRDDLLNRLYHTSFDYKVSALLEDPTALTTAALVLTPRADVAANHVTGEPPRPRPTMVMPAPGSTTVDLDPSPEVH